MKRFLLLLAAAAALAVPASAATPPTEQGPGAFVSWELHQVSVGRWPKLWERIHPAQRKHVKVLLYVACNAQIETGWTFQKIRVTGIRDVKASVPGTAIRNVAAKAVTVRMTLVDSTKRSVTQKQTVNVFHVKGIWYSALTAAQVKAYKAGKCLGAPTG